VNNATGDTSEFARDYVPAPLTATSGNDAFYLRMNSAGTELEIFAGESADGEPIYTGGKQVLPASLDLGAGDDVLTLDFVNGNPLLPGGIVFAGDAGDKLRLAGGDGADALSVGANRVTMNGVGINYSGIGFLSASLGGGADLFRFEGSSLKLNLRGGSGDNRTIVESGVMNADFDLGTGPGEMSLEVNGTARVNLGATQHLASLTVNDSAEVKLIADGGRVLRARELMIGAGAIVDLADNDLILQATALTRQEMLAALLGQMVSGRNGGTWDGNGLSSSSAASDPRNLTGLMAGLNRTPDGQAIRTVFSGEAVDANSILVKHSWLGDVDLSGKVDADDYFIVDGSFAEGLVDSPPGDIDLSGIVDADDYFLMDLSFASQDSIL
jgi:hypothetical protein